MSAPAHPPKPAAAPGDHAPLRAVETGATLARRHLRWGWWSLLVFLTLGLALEALHAFKVGAYLNVSQETRRLMWTLAHAHGTLLALVHLGFAAAARAIPDWPARPRGAASLGLRGAGLLMPAGFFLGGVWARGGDPGVGILLVPVGGVMLFVAVLLAALASKHAPVEEPSAASLHKPGGDKHK
jgi:hypothetical protein